MDPHKQERGLQEVQAKEQELVENAACKGVPQEIFFQPQYLEQALIICDDCPMRLECRDYAIKNKIVDGVWGGLSPNRLRTIVGEV